MNNKNQNEELSKKIFEVEPVKKKKSALIEWAEREIEIACKRENPNRKNNEWDCGCACYESALKALKSLAKDGHSGFSISITKNILNRLIDRKPLTPINGDEDEWNFIHENKEKKYLCYQNKRMSSLFKDVYDDGTIKYSDNNRIIMVDVDNPKSSWHNGFVQKIAEEYIGEIEMPYMPMEKPYVVYCEEFLTDEKNGDFDTIGILYYIDPIKNETHTICRYFKESEHEFVEISEDEYKQRYLMHEKRLEKIAKEQKMIDEKNKKDDLIIGEGKRCGKNFLIEKALKEGEIFNLGLKTGISEVKRQPYGGKKDDQ